MESLLKSVFTLINIGALQIFCVHYSIQNSQQLAVVCTFLHFLKDNGLVIAYPHTVNEQLTDTR